MSEENERIIPKTDFEIFRNYANQCVWKILKNDSGAGANAASRVDMTFAATDPLSELVWSPENGLSLKCADSSFADKNNSLYVGPSNMALAPPQSVTGGRSTTDEPIAVGSAKSDIATTSTPTMRPTSDPAIMPECKAYEENDKGSGGNEEGFDTAERAPDMPNVQNENLVNGWEKITRDQANNETEKTSGIERNKCSAISDQVDQRPYDSSIRYSDEPKPSMERNPSPSRCSNEGIDIGIGKMTAVSDDNLYARVEPAIACKGSCAPGSNLASSSRVPLEKRESTAENDLRNFNGVAAYAATSGVLVNDIKRKSQGNDVILVCDKTLQVLHSPSHSRIRMTKNKGKEKSLSDGNADVRLSEEDNDSHSSVESCNSGGYFSSGKKRCNFQQQLMIGSKRVKRQIQETPVSKCCAKQDSSFMNWISNMVKGISQSVQDDSNTLALGLANPDYRNLRPDEKLITWNANQDLEQKSMGFKSIFQSIYCLNLKTIETRMSHQEGEGCGDLESEPGKMLHGIDATPITCCAENNNLHRQVLQSNKSEESNGKYDVGPSSQPKMKPLNFFYSHENSKDYPAEKKDCSMLSLRKDKEVMPSHSSSTRPNTNSATENIDSNTLCETKEAENICHKSDTRSLWITRFSSKSIAPSIISDHLDERGRSQAQSTDFSKPPNPSKQVSYLNNCKVEETREQSADYTEACTGLKEDKGNSNHKLKSKFIPLPSSSGFRNSEPMASMFARRLGAIKHIIPTNRTDNSTQLCLFCGTKGHQLSHCSDISESEVEDLQKNINSYGGSEEVPCFCIKCFQPNHWAISCPISMSKGKHEPEVHAWVYSNNDGSVKLLTGEDGQTFSSSHINDGTDHQAERNLNLKRKLNEIMSSNIGCSSSFKKYCTSSSEENKLKENPLTSPLRFTKRKISHVPKAIFDAVRNLRLSRTDILRWINTHGSISQLGGFFLRLRLGKWEEGLGGTGYYVASINEGHGQSSEQNTRKSLSVNVGGIKCMVESQYISNQDFLEDEIMEWWSTTSEADTEIPSEDDLREKTKRKKLLGL